MPILDPSLQCCLLTKFGECSKKGKLNFFLYYLRVASNYMNKNVSTIEASILFREDLKRGITFVNDELGCDFKIGQDFNFAINDYYKHMYDRIALKKFKNKRSHTQIGSYFILNDKFNTRLYRPSDLYSQQHAWFFSDTPIAILSIFDKPLSEKFKQFVKLEIDLMAAAGFTLVLCAIGNAETMDFYFQLIKDNQFAEIHFNVIDDSFLPDFFIKINRKMNTHFDHYKGYFYIYSHFPYPGKDDETIALNLRKRPRFKTIFYSQSFEKTFIKLDYCATKPFLYCKNGFKSDYLRIRLSNVPLYDHRDPYSDLIPTRVSDFSLGYIAPSDFLTWKKERIKILFRDDESDRHSKKYINFNDLHILKPSYYVNSPLFLTDIPIKKLEDVKKIRENIKKKYKKKIKSDHIFSLFQNQKIREGIENVGYVYQNCFRKEISDFTLYENQILTALEACKSFVTRINDNDDKGMIYQVKTGEGKSCIVCLIAAVLALMGKTIHITSSNIKLANRDYCKSYKFFHKLGLESSILLHANELPFSFEDKKKENDSNDLISKSSLVDIDPNSNIPLNSNIPQKSSSNIFLAEFEKDNEIDEFFGSVSSEYLSKSIQSEKSSFRGEYYPKKFFNEELFNNPSRMNYSICGIDNNNRISKSKANIIFSTFVNFECLYLRMMETCRGYVDDYFKSCALIIDEADSILLDEINNGTIVSREMKTNAKPILKYVYKQKINNRPAQETYENIIKYWPKHGSLDIKDVEQMYEEIELVNEAEFSNGKKYSIETIQVKNTNKIKRFCKKTSNYISKAAKKITKIFKSKKIENKQSNEELEKQELEEKYLKSSQIEIQAVSESENKEEEEEEDNDDLENEEDEKIEDGPVTEFKHIVPFDYDHKGILEPNKEFSGFIQQFIAIKEGLQKGNENMIIRDLSMNYLYVSHPIFVKLYGKVFGFTGTVGSKKDQEIYKSLYKLNTTKVPRNKPNLKVKLPMILCDTIDERDRMIVSEVRVFHDKGFPVLVVFQDLNEIVKVEYLLNSKGIKYINIFDGKDDIVKPDMISGINAAVSLGTNVCGRGIDIRIQSKPLHVILTYYSSNKRVMSQASGRTARQGQRGTCRIICLKDQYYDPIQMSDNTLMNKAIEDFRIKNKQQEHFIEHFKRKRPWIFSGEIKKQKFDKKQIGELRNAKINVNRIVAYKYEYPICMTTEIFLSIQAQKIFSIFNCPNSKYTWILFQRYLREMILESWSLMLNKFDQENAEIQGTKIYQNLLRAKRKELYKQIEEYIQAPTKSDDYGIIPTFMNIYKKVIEKYQDKILNIYPKIQRAYKQSDSGKFISFRLGFHPYSLLSNSGARINAGTIGEMNYIIDPELRYERKMNDKRLIIASITEHIDSLFNLICQFIGGLVGEYTGLKMFLRRTLGGCEFGLCFDILLKVEDPNSEILNDFYCLIDKDPLLSFTIFVKNVYPILAGILIIALAFIAIFSGKIASLIAGFPEYIAKKGIKLIVNFAAEVLVKEVLQKVFFYISDIVKKQIDNLMVLDLKAGIILRNLFNIFETLTFTNIGKKISEALGRKIKINLKSKLSKLCVKSLHYGILIKIGLMIILLIGSFIMSFIIHKQSLKDESKEFDKHYDPNTAKKLVERRAKKIPKDNLAIVVKEDEENQLKHGFDEFKQTTMKSFLFKMELSDPYQFIVNPNDFKIDLSAKKEMIRNAYIQYLIQTSRGKKCFSVRYSGNTNSFKQQVVFYSTFNNMNPSILPFVGYFVERKNGFIYHELPENGFLDEYIKKEKKDIIWSYTGKFIIAYGIAHVMRYLHDDCHIIHYDLKPSNICLNLLLYPFIYNFYNAKQIEKNEKSMVLKDLSLRFMAPELVDNSSKVKCSFKVDVYSYGMLLYNVMTEIEPFNNYNKKEDLMCAIVRNERPKFPDSILPIWKELITRCWDQDPDKRPTFKEILNELNSPKFQNDHIKDVLDKYKKKFLKEK